MPTYLTGLRGIAPVDPTRTAIGLPFMNRIVMAVALRGDLFAYEAPPPPPPEPDITVPTVSNFDPIPGSALSFLAPISFDAMDDSGFGRVMIAVRYNALNGITDLAYDGTNHLGRYLVTSVPITGGRRYTIRRRDGWPAHPTFRVFAVDAAGNEA